MHTKQKLRHRRVNDAGGQCPSSYWSRSVTWGAMTTIVIHGAELYLNIPGDFQKSQGWLKAFNNLQSVVMVSSAI